MLLLHGIGGSSQSFLALAELLALQGHSAHAWDAPGYGNSKDPTYEDIDHVDAVMSVVGEIEGPVHLVGTSWGGTLAARVALSHPDAVHTLTLIDSTRGSAVTPDRRRKMQARLRDLLELGSEQFASRRAANLLSPHALPQHLDAVRSVMGQVRPPGYRAVVDMMTRTDLGPDLPRLTHSTLVLVGEHDTVTGVEESRYLAATIPHATFGLILGAGHSAVVERPVAVAEQLTRFWGEPGSALSDRTSQP